MDAPLVEVRGLTKRFGDRVAVDGLHFAIARGEVFGLLGPNGAGKTTTIRLLLGLLVPSAGQVRVDGLVPHRHAIEVRRRIGWVPQAPALDPLLTGREHLVLMARLYGVPDPERRAAAALREFGLAEAADRLILHYSGGMKKRLELAAGMLHDPPLLVLDEPTAGLDVATRHEVWDRVRRLRARGTTVLLTTHHLDEADALCDRVAIVDRGRLVALDTPARLKARHGRPRVRLGWREPEVVARAADRCRAALGSDRVWAAGGVLEVEVGDPVAGLQRVLDRLAAEGLPRPETVEVRAASLDQVFARLTGRAVDPLTGAPLPAAGGGGTGVTSPGADAADAAETRAAPAAGGADGGGTAAAREARAAAGSASARAPAGEEPPDRVGAGPGAPAGRCPPAGRPEPAPAARMPLAAFARQHAAFWWRWWWRLRREGVELALSLVQPALWLVLFGHLWEGVVGPAWAEGGYLRFMTAGAAILTVFNGALQGGVELLFDRQSGALERYLAAPVSPLALVTSRFAFITVVYTLQTLVILAVAALLGVRFAAGWAVVPGFLLLGVLLGAGVAAGSLALAVSMERHGRFFAIERLVSLPLILLSSLFAPVEQMPAWLARLAQLNPLTHAIDGARHLVLHGWDTGRLATAAAYLVAFDALLGAVAALAARRGLRVG